MYPVIDKSLFRSTWPQLYEPDSAALDSDLLTTFYLIVAIGDVNDKSPAEIVSQAGQITQSLYQKSWAMLHDCLAVPNVSTVQILLLHVSDRSTQSYVPPSLTRNRSSSTCNVARRALLGSFVEWLSAWHKLLDYTGEAPKISI